MKRKCAKSGHYRREMRNLVYQAVTVSTEASNTSFQLFAHDHIEPLPI